MLSILSWNIRQGGGTRISKILSALTTAKPEIIVLSEYQNNISGLKIRSGLLQAGYRFQHVTPAPSKQNSAAIFSKLPCDQYLFPHSDETYPHNVLASEFDAFTVVGMYLPHKKKHLLFDFLLEYTRRDKPCILVGDFNSGINGVDQAGKSFWYEDKLLALQKQGYKDAFRHLHGSVREYSWFSHQGNGYRYDHTYVEQSLLPITTKCAYLHSWREEGLSDHSPMLLGLG
jgi:exonuclease III